jgi:hypothetical protein
VLVLHGRRSGALDRVELVHARPAADDDLGRLEVRSLAVCEVGDADVVEAREVAQGLWRVADDAGFSTGRRDRDARGVQRLNAALGRATDGARGLGLRREPLAWAAGAWTVLALVFALGVPLGDDPLEHGAGIAVGVVLWPVLTAVLLWRAARRVRDPVDAD